MSAQATSHELHYARLRSWAKGAYPTEAATEMLIRAGFAQPGRLWIQPDGWIDFASIPDHIGGMSGGEQRFLMLAASIGAGVNVDLNDAVPGLDRELVDLVLAAIAHAAGSHDHSLPRLDFDAGTIAGFDRPGTLHPWPSQKGRGHDRQS